MTVPIPGGRRRVDRICDPAFIEGLPGLSIGELRRRREDARAEEADLTFIRRMLQGRLDMVTAEQKARQDGGSSPQESAQMIADLLAEASGTRSSTPASPRHVSTDPAPQANAGRRSTDQAVLAAVSSEVARQDDEALATVADALRKHEQEVSQTRQMVHQVLDALTSELARRYRSGDVEIEQALSDNP